MAKYAMKKDREFKEDSAVGHVIPRAVLYEGHGVQTSIVRMHKGQNLGLHRHDSWIQVFVLSGKLHCSIEDRTCEPGDSYFVEPGDEHVEIGLEENTEVLLIKALPNLQYPVTSPSKAAPPL
jgi:quercetin dioxygenase-like cupin family protein